MKPVSGSTACGRGVNGLSVGVDAAWGTGALRWESLGTGPGTGVGWGWINQPPGSQAQSRPYAFALLESS